jgi:hypothetical protein
MAKTLASNIVGRRVSYDRLPALAGDLVRRQVSVIAATGGEPAPQVVKAATQTITIVFMANGDPVASGLVGSTMAAGRSVEMTVDIKESPRSGSPNGGDPSVVKPLCRGFPTDFP